MANEPESGSNGQRISRQRVFATDLRTFSSQNRATHAAVGHLYNQLLESTTGLGEWSGSVGFWAIRGACADRGGSGLVAWRAPLVASNSSSLKNVLDGLEWEQRNLVAGYLKGSGVSLRVVDAPIAAGDLPLQIEFELASRSCRVAGANGLAPDDTWCAPLQSSASIEAVGQLPALSGRLVASEAIQISVPGTFVERKLGRELEGSLRGFGNRFLNALTSAEPRLKDVLAFSSRLTAYRYEDKHVTSPLITERGTSRIWVPRRRCVRCNYHNRCKPAAASNANQ